MIKAVLFDMDGVIIDSEMEYLQKLFQFAREKNPEVKLSDLYQTVGSIKQDSWMVVERAVHNGQSWQELHAEYLPRWKKVYEETDYRAIFRPEISKVMQSLKKLGLRLAVASSTELEQVKKVLTLNQVMEYLECVVSGSTLQRSKPDPEIYLYTAAQLQVKPEECLVIEDSTVGITAGHRAGMTVAALIDDRFSFDRSLADIELNSLEEIPKLVERLAGKQR